MDTRAGAWRSGDRERGRGAGAYPKGPTRGLQPARPQSRPPTTPMSVTTIACRPWQAEPGAEALDMLFQWD